MKTILLALAAAVAAATVAIAQQPVSPGPRAVLERRPSDVLDVAAPSARVRGVPGSLTVQDATCRSLPMSEVRRRIVEIAAQEWGFFGLTVVDQTKDDPRTEVPRSSWRRRSWLDPAESARVADSIAGYWTITPEGGWILDEQNARWNGPTGVGARWRYPWSAAFVSWVMCEAGLGDAGRFRRAVAHHVYIDQAIRAAADGPGAFAARDIGEAPIVPGDLLCSARRPAYRSLAERRRQLGDGARTHCDIVVQVDEARSRILAIGGNVRGTVSLKLLPAAAEPGGPLRPAGGRRPMFAHLQLRADAIADDALEQTHAMRALVCGEGRALPAALAAANVVATRRAQGRC